MATQYQAERDNLQAFERELDELRAQSDYLSGVIQEKEEAVSEFNKMIEESEKAYTRVDCFCNQLVDKSAELLQALDSEANSLRMRLRPGKKEKEKKEVEGDEDAEGEEENDDEDDEDED